MNAAPISIRGLVKTFGRTRALDGLDLSVGRGEVHGFLGPNGAGKSTTLRVLLGMLRSDSGDVALLGGDPWADAATLHRRLAYVPGDVNLWPSLTGGEMIDLLDPTRRGRTYSKGNRQKVALVAALSSDVELLLLDEPTSGLDPLMEAVFSSSIERFRDDGGTVLLSSHILAEVERLCDRVSIIRSGRCVETGTLSELRHLTRTSVHAETSRPIGGLGELPWVHDLDVDGQRSSFEVDSDRIGDLLPMLQSAAVLTLTITPPTLEELFLRHYGDEVDTQT